MGRAVTVQPVMGRAVLEEEIMDQSVMRRPVTGQEDMVRMGGESMLPVMGEERVSP
jgi:hypothetical protein